MVFMSQSTPTTRFAPSPTGFLHIGGARTALFNWLFARGRGGRFVLRIEDTDRERSTPEAEAAILDGLTWLGLDWDGDPISQHARAERHQEVVAQLLASGDAYRCYVPAEALEQRRSLAEHVRAAIKAPLSHGMSQAEAEHLHALGAALSQAYRSPFRSGDVAPPSDDAPFVVRLKGPLSGKTVIGDAVQGDVVFANEGLDDLILLRSDGSPTYNLAVVADDHDMGVTHVIRGDDHLANAARQSLIYKALGWAPPVFAHVPLIHGPDGKKLSKRHGALGVDAYRDMGYLPEGLRNYLLRLGFSYGDQEVFTDAEAQETFDVTRLNKAAARFDFDKLASINAHHMKALTAERASALLLARLAEDGRGDWDAGVSERLNRAAPVLKDRAKTVVDMADMAGFVLSERPLVMSGKAAKTLDDAALERVAKARSVLADAPDWSEAALSAALQSVADMLGVGFGKVGAPLRAALTAGAPSPDLAQVLTIFGREESLARLDDAVSRATAS